jgi:hypothetical protein
MVDFISHLKSPPFGLGDYHNIDTTIHSLSNFRFKQYCSLVFDWIGTDIGFTKEIVFPDPISIDTIVGCANIFLPPHSATATCWLYKNKNINNNFLYCQRDLLPFILNYININNETILVVGDGDPSINLKDIESLQYKFLIANNICLNNNKIIPLPCGFRLWTYSAEKQFLALLNRYVIKYKNIYIKFSINTNKDREKIYEICKKNKLAIDNIKVESSVFLKELKQHFFVVSPESNGIDSSRTWEALYCQTIPIVKRSIVTEFYSKIFPMVILDDWEELANYKFDHNLYYEIISKYPDYTQYLDARNLWKYILDEINRRENEKA